ncbi:unnamed protein product [Anisakis simplex]|uniref:Exocyst complex component 5 n=1 Tax=Anisakis simplex TaxID=6269 RepID=A0A3P6SE97_ANISI|nr:unnamed protein product [Anisakis simplex]
MTGNNEEINVIDLKTKFEEEIGNLQMLSDQFQSKIASLEQQCNSGKKEYLNILHSLHDQNANALDKLKQLDSTMQSVSTKVVHLGDQLESVHIPRARASEALQLIKHFDEFLADQPLNSDIFTDPDRLLESASMIQKLSLISQELSKDKYNTVQIRIAHKYDEIERLMIEEFVRAHRVGDRFRMKRIANILSEFKGYSQCLDAFVEHMQINAFRGVDIFDDMLTLCQKTQPMLEEIFPNPEQVMSKLVLNFFHGKLQETLCSKLSDPENDLDAYLNSLHDLYARTQKLVSNLSTFKVGGSDAHFLPTLVHSVFVKYLETYPKYEQQFLCEQCKAILSRYYDSKGHHKKQITSGGLQDLKRDIQARLLNVDNYGGETFLSEEVAINILHEAKNAFQRGQLLCMKEESSKVIETIFDILIRYLYTEHVDYAIDLSLAGISLAEPKSEPPNYFFGVVQQAGAITHLFTKQYDDFIYPLIEDSEVEESCAKKRDGCLRSVEGRLNLGLERQLNSLIGYVRFILSSEQKKQDFRPDEDNQQITVMSNACAAVVKYISAETTVISECVDGGNLRTVMSELSERFYRTILAHIYQFSYNSQGAMLLLCDINEYRKCAMLWKIAEVSKKFESLQALANLLVVVPENLNEACSSQLLVSSCEHIGDLVMRMDLMSVLQADIDRGMVNNFIQLRVDYRSARLHLNVI